MSISSLFFLSHPWLSLSSSLLLSFETTAPLWVHCLLANLIPHTVVAWRTWHWKSQYLPMLSLMKTIFSQYLPAQRVKPWAKKRKQLSHLLRALPKLYHRVTSFHNSTDLKSICLFPVLQTTLVVGCLCPQPTAPDLFLLFSLASDSHSSCRLYHPVLCSTNHYPHWLPFRFLDIIQPYSPWHFETPECPTLCQALKI